jgi:hypothetical protein
MRTPLFPVELLERCCRAGIFLFGESPLDDPPVSIGDPSRLGEPFVMAVGRINPRDWSPPSARSVMSDGERTTGDLHCRCPPPWFPVEPMEGE